MVARGRVVMRLVFRYLSLPLVFFILGGTAGVPLAQAAVLKTLSGRVESVDTAKEILMVEFTHPATGIIEMLPFHVTRETGLNGFRTLPDMKTEDIVTVDYEEQPDGISKALYVAKFRISGPPTGMENFKGF